MRDTGEISRIW